MSRDARGNNTYSTLSSHTGRAWEAGDVQVHRNRAVPGVEPAGGVVASTC